MSKLVAAIISPLARIFGPATFVLFASAAFAQVPSTSTPGTPAQLPPRDAQQPQTGSAIVRGRVTAADTGSPLRSAQVRIMSNTLREPRAATTDIDGRYEFKELPAGRYDIYATKSSYVSLFYGQRRPFESGLPLEIGAGLAIDKIDFTLPRGGVITGRIVDEYGEPAAEVAVSVMRYSYQQGRRQLVSAGRVGMTSDIGEYRIFGLAPGDYYVRAAFQANSSFGAASDDRSGYAPIFYPGTLSTSAAQKVTVPVGQTVSNINMALIVARTSRVSGTVVDADGRLVISGLMTMSGRDGSFITGTWSANIRPDGTFTLSNVAPGEYTLRASFSRGMTIDLLSGTAEATVTVSGGDVEGVRVAAQRPGSASGRIVLEGALPSASPRASLFGVGALPLDPGLTSGSRSSGEVHDDFTFDLKVLPCVCAVQAYANRSTGWYLKSVKLNGTDVSDAGIDFRSDQQIDGLEIHFTNHPAELSGIVRMASGDPSRDYTLVLFARDRERWKPGSRYLATSRPDQDGRYKLRGIPAADYYAIAVDYVEQGQWTDPEYLDRIKAGATSLTIGDGETKTLDLKLVTGS